MNPSKESSVFKYKESDELANLIKSTHKTLRVESQNKDEEEVRVLWLKHTKNKKLLQEYSDAMHTLATQHWELKKNVSRIKWTYEALKEYFYGGLQSIKLEKETRRVSLLQPTSLKDYEHKARAVLKRYEEINKLRILDVGSCYNPFGKFDDLEVTPIDLHPAIPEVYRCDFLYLKITEGEGEVEDVSSPDAERSTKKRESMDNEYLYQGSKKHNFNNQDYVLNIDKHNKRISENNDDKTTKKRIKYIEEQETDGKTSIHSSGTVELGSEESSDENIILSENNLEKLSANKDVDYDISELEANSYDAVIFSYFLEYIPTAKLRYECCLKAYNLLKPSGILCIVTPDSKHLSANILFFKLWKCALALVGFERVKFEKCPHFHAMTFRKVLSPSTLIDHAEKDLKVMESIQFFSKFPTLNWQTVRNSLYIIQDMQLMKEEGNKCKK